MSLVDDAVAVAAPQGGREVQTSPAAVRGSGPVPCAARPGSRLVHLDGRCECFFGGPPPEFLGSHLGQVWRPSA